MEKKVKKQSTKSKYPLIFILSAVIVIMLVITFYWTIMGGKIVGFDRWLMKFEKQEEETIQLLEEETGEEDVSTESIVNIPDTDQEYCFDNKVPIKCPSLGDFAGQDAQYEGNSLSYTDNKDGTITDNVTGLMWTSDPGKKVQYNEAVSRVTGINIGGYTDWRVPTIKELYSLIRFSGMDVNVDSNDTENFIPFIDDRYFKFSYGDPVDGDRIIDSQWVTSTIYRSTVMNGHECFFGVNFADGRIKCYPTSNKSYYAIYVRGEAYGDNNFIDNGDTTITDDMTGLMWMQNDNGRGVLWNEALKFCEDLNLAGFNDWRLPNAKELQYIVDYSRTPDTTDSAAIDPIFTSTPITNEAGQKDYPFYWTGTTHITYKYMGENAVYISFGRAVGNMDQFGGWVDVHGAGAQRSDPKSGVSDNKADGFGPQGDAVRSENFIRCVRNGAMFVQNNISIPDPEPQNINIQSEEQGTNLPETPPEAIEACLDRAIGTGCSISKPGEFIIGTCQNTSNGEIACVQLERPKL